MWMDNLKFYMQLNVSTHKPSIININDMEGKNVLISIYEYIDVISWIWEI